MRGAIKGGKSKVLSLVGGDRIAAASLPSWNGMSVTRQVVTIANWAWSVDSEKEQT
jgi:hypothetical protein